MKNLLFVSGWTGRSNLREYFRFDDGRSDMIVRLIDECRKRFNVFLCRSQIEGLDIDTEIHINAQLPVRRGSKKICILLEDSAIRPQNLAINYVCYYKRFFTWNEELLCKFGNAVKIHFPHDYEEGNDFFGKDIFLSNISSNRNVLLNRKRELYTARVGDIDYFDRHEDNFHLYGYGWDKTPLGPGIFPRVIEEFDKRVFGVRKRKKRRSYKGTVPEKRSILARSVFSMAYENIGGLKGYISEKIFDCFGSLAVPIYLPSFEVDDDLIPSGCYIDRRAFKSAGSLHEFLKGLSAEEVNLYRERIKYFNKNMKARFSIDEFVWTILDNI